MSSPAPLLPSALGLARLTLMGQVERLERSSALEALWLERHPSSKAYLGFADFSFYRLNVERARYVAGFGRMGWLNQGRWSNAAPLQWASHIEGIVTHMNQDHASNLIEYVHAERGRAPQRAVMVGVDELGLDVEVFWPDGEQERVRLGFDSADRARRSGAYGFDRDGASSSSQDRHALTPLHTCGISRRVLSPGARFGALALCIIDPEQKRQQRWPVMWR